MSFSSLDEDLQRKLLLLQQHRLNTPPSMKDRPSLHVESSGVKADKLPVHDWGPFGKFEYFGPGTPYLRKQAAGVEPVNDLDRIAMYHDMQYSWTERHDLPGGGLVKSGMRGLSDYGAGAAMMTAAINPFSDLNVGQRILAWEGGVLLQVQGILRLNPATGAGGVLADIFLY